MKIVLVAAFSLCLGCVQSKVAWMEGDAGSESEFYGNYTVKMQRSAISAKDPSVIAKDRLVIREIEKCNQRSSEEPLDVCVGLKCISTTEANGGIAYLNNALSVCTLGIWPYVRAKRFEYEVSVTSKYGRYAETITEGVRSWSSFILPIAALPCPGWGELRSFSEGCDDSLAKGTDSLIDRSIVGAFRSIMTKERYETLLEARRTDRRIHREAIGKLRKKIEDVDAKSDGVDRRPIVYLDENSVQNNTESQVNEKSIIDRVENALMMSGMRVETDHSIIESVRNSELFSVVKGEKTDLVAVERPAFRADVSILQCKCVAKNEERTWKKHKKHTFKETDRRDYTEKIESKSAIVELNLRLVNIKTGETVLSKNVLGKDSAEHSLLTEEYSGRKGNQKSNLESGGDLRSDEYYIEKATDEAMRQFATSMFDVLPFHITSCTTAGVVTIDAPGWLIKKGMLLDVLNLGNPMSGKNGKVSRSETKVATIEVTSVEGDRCTGEFTSILDAECNWDVVVRRKQ